MIEAEEDITRLSNIFNLNGAWFCGELELSMNIREVSQSTGLLPVASINAIDMKSLPMGILVSKNLNLSVGFDFCTGVWRSPS